MSGRPPRVVFVNRFYTPCVSATSQMLGGIAPALAQRGAEVIVVTSRQLYDDPHADLAAKDEIAGVQVIRIRGTRFGRDRLSGRAVDYLSFYASAAWTLLRLVRRGTVVVAKTDPPLVALACLPGVWLRGGRLVNWLQDVFPEVATHLGEKRVPRWLAGVLERLRDATCRSAAENVVIGERMREFFLARRVPSERLRIIPNWADGNVIRLKPAGESDLRRELGWSGAFVVAYCGNLGRAHDYATLLGAAEALRADDGVRFLMVGGGAGMAALRRAVAERGLQAFTFLPYQPEGALSDVLAAADVHLVCLKPELEGLVLPSKLYGIFAAGRPALFWGDVDGEVARELARTGAGLSVRVGDGAALAAALRTLRADPTLCQQAGARAHGAFLARYTREHAVSDWWSLLLTLNA